MGYETKLYLVELSDYDIPEEDRETGREITPAEYKELVKQGARIQAETEPLQRIVDEELEHEGHTALREQLSDDFDSIWKPLSDFRHENMVWGKVIGMVDMCKLGYDGPLVELLSQPSTGYKGYIPFIFGTDGNSIIFQDRYGDPFGVHDPKEIAKIAHEEYEKDDYRRLGTLIGMLVGSLQHDWGSLRVLSYGY